MNNKQVVESFFDGHKDSGSNPNVSLFFEKDIIYSYGYHFPIAKIDRENSILYLTLQKYSVTTQRHISLVMNNCPYFYNIEKVYIVPLEKEDLTTDWLYREVELSAIEFRKLQSKKNSARTRKKEYHKEMLSISEAINELAFEILKLQSFSELPNKFEEYKHIFDYKLLN